jgi:lysozyme family protein
MKFSDFIKDLQKAMNAQGEALEVDGDPGAKTRAALEEFDASLTVVKVGDEPSAPPVDGPITTGQDADEGTAPWYRKMFARCKVSPGKESMLKSAVAQITRGMPQYREVAKRLGAEDVENFSFILGAIHFKEASCDFTGVLHNGERIIGTGKKTSLVPKGRGPFSSWADAAVDAIGIESTRWVKLLANEGDIGDVLWALERYNGTGYISGAGKTETSPYLWACSNINDGKGKYVADGHFDSGASTGATPGAALILKNLSESGLFKVKA